MDKKSIKCLTEFLAYTNDSSLFALFYLLFGQSFFEEFERLIRSSDITIKELFVSILMNQVEEILNIKKYDVEEVLSASIRLKSDSYFDDKYDKEQDKRLYAYFETIFFNFPSYLDYSVIDETIKKCVEKYNTMVDIFQSCRNIILSQINIIEKYIEHYQIKSTYRKDFVYKNLLNKLIANIVKNRRFCFLYADHVTQVRLEPYQEGRECIITKEYKLIYENNSLCITDNKQCIVKTKIKNENLIRNINDGSYYIKNFSDHTYINSNLNKAIDKFDKLVDSSFCPICNPIRLNENHKNPDKKGHLVQMCKFCKRMFNAIREISELNNDSKERFTTKKIRERIKSPNKIEAKKSPEERKLKHFQRLYALIKEIMKAESEKENEKIKIFESKLKPLIELQFKEFIKK